MRMFRSRCVVRLFLLIAFAAQGFAQTPAKQSTGAKEIVIERHSLQLSADAAPSAAEMLRHVHVEAITYLSDGLRIQGYLAVPDGPGPFPCVIVNRGGNPNLGVWTDETALQSLGRFASWGYVAVASQYRGAAGSQGKDEYGGADVDDVTNLIPLLGMLPVADMNRIGMFGASRGGMMTYLALTHTDKIRAAVVLSGMSDLKETLGARPEMARIFNNLIPDFSGNKDASIQQRSAIRWVDKLPANVPLLLIHGTADWRVSPSQAFDMARALMDAKHPVRFIMYEGGSHGVPEFAAQRDSLMHEWLDAYVRDGRKWPELKPHGD